MSEVLEVWIKSLKKPTTARVYGHYLGRLFKEAGISPEEAVEKSKTDPHFETYKALKKKALGTFTAHGSYLAVCAVRKFLYDHDVDNLPAPKVEHPETVREIVEFEDGKEWKTGLAICAAAGKPYGLVFKLMLHCGWGAGEFLKFNTVENWEYVKKVLQSGEPHEYVVHEFKGRKKNRNKFSSLIPVGLLREILASTAVPIRASHGYSVMDGHRIHATGGVPLNETHYNSARIYLEAAFKTAVKRANIIVKGSPSLHILRAIFRTQAQLVGCDGAAAEFVMGHTVDSLGYNRSCKNKAFLWQNLSRIWEEPTPQAVSAVVDENRQLRERIRKLESEKVDVWDEIAKNPEKLDEIMRSAFDRGIYSLEVRKPSKQAIAKAKSKKGRTK